MILFSTGFTQASAAERLEYLTAEPKVPGSNPTTDMTLDKSNNGHCGTSHDSMIIERVS